MIKKIFTSTVLFIIVFVVVSAVADVSYYKKLSWTPGKEGLTCWCDFKVFWTAGYRMNNYAFGPAADSKNPEYEKDIEGYIGGNRSCVYDKLEPFYHFRYSPFTAFLMIPFGLIAYPAHALALWFSILNIALAASLLLLARQIYSDFRISRAIRCVILWFVFIATLRFYLMNISNGQSDVIIALFFVLLLTAYIRGNELACGIIFALILQFKPMFLPMLLYFLFAGKKRLVLAAVLGALAFIFAPVVLIGFDKTAALLKDWTGILSLSVSSQLANVKNQSIPYFLGRSEHLSYILSTLFTLSAYAALLFLKRSSKAAEDKKFKYLEISLLIIISLLFSPLTWISHFICRVVPVGTMALFLFNSTNRKPLYGALGGFLIFSMVVGTDITKFIPVIGKARFINIALGTLFLTYALVSSYRQQSAR